MMTREDRDALRRLWEGKAPDDTMWRGSLTEEASALVVLWDMVRRDQEDRAVRAWWEQKTGKEVMA